MRHAAGGPGWRTALRVSAGVLAWSAGAVSAIVVGTLALSLISSGLADRTRPLAVVPGSDVEPQVVESSAAASPIPTYRPSPRPSSSTSGRAVERTMTFAPGAVTARCQDGLAFLVSWSPAQGFRADDVRQGPAMTARVTFEAFRGGEYTVLIRCAGGTPQGTVGQGTDGWHDH